MAATAQPYLRYSSYNKDISAYTLFNHMLYNNQTVFWGGKHIIYWCLFCLWSSWIPILKFLWFHWQANVFIFNQYPHYILVSYLLPGWCVPHPRLMENWIMWDIVEGRTGKTWKKSTAQTFLFCPWWFFCLRQNLVAGVWSSGLMTRETKDETLKTKATKITNSPHVSLFEIF